MRSIPAVREGRARPRALRPRQRGSRPCRRNDRPAPIPTVPGRRALFRERRRTKHNYPIGTAGPDRDRRNLRGRRVRRAICSGVARSYRRLARRGLRRRRRDTRLPLSRPAEVLAFPRAPGDEERSHFRQAHDDAGRARRLQRSFRTPDDANWSERRDRLDTIIDHEIVGLNPTMGSEGIELHAEEERERAPAGSQPQQQ